MRLHRLTIQGFRNLKKTDLTFSEDPLIAFVGRNGQGKTNLLEAIYLLAFSKSFRTAENRDFVGFAEDFCRIGAEVEGRQGRETLTLTVTRHPLQKGLKINGVDHKATDYIGHLASVFFSPEDLLMVHGAPRLRRRYMDMLLIQLDHDYLTDLMTYNGLLKQRNALLRQIRLRERTERDLPVWDERVTALGFALIKRRREVLGPLRERVRAFYAAISGTSAKMRIDYRFSASEPPRDLTHFRQLFERFRPRDIETAATTVGPHRDDLRFVSDGNDVGQFGSRGEWRSLVLALKLAEIELLKERFQQAPLLLLDDVFSELDEERAAHLFQAISGCQTFITTTHREFLEPLSGNKRLLFVEEGALKETEAVLS